MLQYRTQFPQAIITSEETLTILSDKCKEQNKNTNFGFKNGHKVNLNKTPWNKGQTKDSNDIIKR